MGEFGTATFGGKTYALTDYPYRDDDDALVVPTTEGAFRFLGVYLASVRFGGLDYDPGETVTLVGNNRVWERP